MAIMCLAGGRFYRRGRNDDAMYQWVRMPFFDGTAFQYRSAMERQKGRAILSCTALLLPKTKKQNFVVYFPGYPA